MHETHIYRLASILYTLQCMHKCTCIVHDRASVRFQGRMIESSSSFLGCKWAAAVAELVSVTKGSDCCPSPVAFRFAVGKKTSSFWHKAAASSRSLFFCWEIPGIFDRRTRASIEYEFKLQCKLIN